MSGVTRITEHRIQMVLSEIFRISKHIIHCPRIRLVNLRFTICLRRIFIRISQFLYFSCIQKILRVYKHINIARILYSIHGKLIAQTFYKREIDLYKSCSIQVIIFLIAICPQIGSSFGRTPERTGNITICISFIPISITIITYILMAIRRQPCCRLNVCDLTRIRGIIIRSTHTNRQPLSNFCIHFSHESQLFIIITYNQTILFHITG
ncbi:unknown [Parabacteroides johnsonii CAG:246]|nr:unknown [Parabacteroides johnsonii CAG:246]